MISSFVLMLWLGIATQMAKARGLGHSQMKALSVENCDTLFGINFANTTSTITSGTHQQQYGLLNVL